MSRGGNEHQDIEMGEEKGSSQRLTRKGNYKDVVVTLEQSDELYRLLFESMQQGVICQNANGDVMLVNPAAEHILGQNIEQLRSLSSPFWKAIHEDGSVFFLNNYPAMVAARTRKAVSNVIMGIFHPEERAYCWLNVSAIPVLSTGSDSEMPDRIFTIFSDCTQWHREALLGVEHEAHVRALERGRVQRILDSMLILTDALVASELQANDLRYLLLESMVSELSEISTMTYGARFTMLTRYVLNCQHVLCAELAADGALLYPLWTSEHWSSDDGGGSEQAHGIPLETLCPDTEQLARFKTGELLTLHVSLPLFVTPDVQQVMVPLMYRGELIGSMGIAYSNSYNGHSSAPATHLYGQDMVLLKIVARLATLIVQGEREQREKERLVQSWQASNEEVEHIHEMKQDFVSIVNREIRATLLNMQRASEIISHQKTSREVGREFALDIYSDARRLVHMIDHMTNLARLEGSRIKLYATWLNINTLITEVLRQWRFVLARRRIQVQTQLANTMPLLQGDRNRLLQVINTMLDYILRYVPQDSELLIQSYVEEQFVRVSMYCRSVYIPSTVLERIFSPSDGEHDAVEGQIRHGYGVQQETALQEIVQHHGGHIWAESTPEKGCAFHFTVRFATATTINGDERI